MFKFIMIFDLFVPLSMSYGCIFCNI